MRKLKEEIYALDSVIAEIENNTGSADGEYVSFWKKHIVYLKRTRSKLLKELGNHK